ncbi:MAG: iron-regulated protein [Flavobacteriia bacterium]|nr:MAG: iron-regulated protein [Flavobacteriia bacterium]
MNLRLYITLLSFLMVYSLSAQQKTPYRLYNADGKKKSYRKLLKEAKKADVVLFGELHNNAIAHWLQYELAVDLHRKESLILGFEMLERDNQEVLEQYLRGEIDQKQLDSMARLWHNYKTDYKPLVDFGKDKGLSVFASNIPRRYASMIFHGGFEALDSLPDAEKVWMAPLPIDYDPTLPGYDQMTEMMGGHNGENLPKAQAIKDATMAYFINKYWRKNHVLLHCNGAYHSKDYEGINWYLNRYNPDLKILTITTETVEDVKKFDKDLKHKADFIILVDENMTNTY